MLKHRLSVAEIDDQSAIELPDSGRFRMFHKKFLGVVCATAMVGGVAGALAVPVGAQAAPPAVVIGGGLVNVQVVDLIDGDVLSNNNVGIGVAAGVAAQVCGVTAQVGVIAQQVARTGAFECTNSAGDQTVEITQ